MGDLDPECTSAPRSALCSSRGVVVDEVWLCFQEEDCSLEITTNDSLNCHTSARDTWHRNTLIIGVLFRFILCRCFPSCAEAAVGGARKRVLNAVRSAVRMC